VGQVLPELTGADKPDALPRPVHGRQVVLEKLQVDLDVVVVDDRDVEG
jgi:hypothetical protein